MFPVISLSHIMTGHTNLVKVRLSGSLKRTLFVDVPWGLSISPKTSRRIKSLSY